MKVFACLALALISLVLTACQKEVCPPGSVSYVSDPSLFPALNNPDIATSATMPPPLKIGGKMVQVDRVVEGPVCNDVWKGKVYVACNIQIPEWDEEDKPTFFKDCDLTIEQDTIVYVAAHNDAAYYKGCSCHTGGESE